jgi:hypothetical protein
MTNSSGWGGPIAVLGVALAIWWACDTAQDAAPTVVTPRAPSTGVHAVTPRPAYTMPEVTAPIPLVPPIPLAPADTDAPVVTDQHMPDVDLDRDDDDHHHAATSQPEPTAARDGDSGDVHAEPDTDSHTGHDGAHHDRDHHWLRKLLR